MSKEKTEKVQDVQEKIVDWMNGLEGVVTDNSDAIAQATGNAVELGLWVIRINALQDVITGIVLLILTYMCYRVLHYSIKIIGKVDYVNSFSNEVSISEYEQLNRDPLITKKEGTKQLDADGYFMIAVGSGASGGATLVISLAKLCSVWTWVALIDPKLFIAKRVTESILGS